VGAQPFGDLGDGFVHRLKRTQTKLREGAGGAPVAVDHLARTVARAVHDPGLRAALGEVDRNEGGAQVVRAEPLPRLGVLKEDLPPDARGLQVPSQPCGEIRPATKDKGRALVPKLEPSAQSAHRVGSEGPGARVVGLVLVQRDEAALHVDVLGFDPEGFVSAHAFPIKKGIQDTIAKLHLAASKELHFLIRIQVRHRFSLRCGRNEASGKRVVRQEMEGIDREGGDAVDQQRNGSPCTWLVVTRQAAHDLLRVLQSEARHRDISNEGKHVVFQLVQVCRRVFAELDAVLEALV
jgi:hypothetical protein